MIGHVQFPLIAFGGLMETNTIILIADERLVIVVAIMEPAKAKALFEPAAEIAERLDEVLHERTAQATGATSLIAAASTTAGVVAGAA